MTNSLRVAGYVQGAYHDGENQVTYRFESPHPNWPAPRPDVRGFASYAESAVYHIMQTLKTPNRTMDLTLNSGGLFGEAEWSARYRGVVNDRVYVNMRSKFREMVCEVIDSQTPLKWRSGNGHMECEAGRIYTAQVRSLGAGLDFRLELPFGCSQEDFKQLITAQWDKMNMENRYRASAGTLYVCVTTRRATYALISEVKRLFGEFVQSVSSSHFGNA